MIFLSKKKKKKNVPQQKRRCRGESIRFGADPVGVRLAASGCSLPGRIGQSVTCLTTDALLTADPGLSSLIPARSHTFVEIDHEIISTIILLPSADSLKKGCYKLQVQVCARITH